MGTEAVEDAIREHMVGREWEDAIALVEVHWPALSQHRLEFLGTFLNAVPEGFLRTSPRLVAAKDYANFLPAAGNVRPNRYQHSPTHRGGLLDVLAELTSQSVAARFAGRFSDSVAAVREAQATIRDVSDTTLATIWPVLPDIRLQWAITLELGGMLSDASRCYEETYDEALQFGNNRIAVEAAGTIAFNYGFSGDRKRAENWLARRPTLSESQTDTVRVMGELGQALLAATALEPEQARASLDSALSDDIAPEPWALRLYTESILAVVDGDLRAQLARLSSTRGAHPESAWNNGLNAEILALAEAELSLSSGDMHATQRALTAVTWSGDLKPHATVLRAWAELRRGGAQKAVALAGTNTGRQVHVRVTAERLAVLAAANLALAQPKEAAAHFRSLIRLVLQEKLYSVLLRFTRTELETLIADTDEAHSPELTRVVTSLSLTLRQQRTLSLPNLSPRERVVLRHLVTDQTIQQIATTEHLSPNTIKSQARTIYRKLGVTNREQALRTVAATPEILT
ncbi:hypothetical protein B7R21_01500 [Subtercola boreus]|uniref:HTH luxR-type domain-containing protein n=1 Tax=Subtercola boreus TaxID=120213 RepID=A0A3E0W363_9MICO|nr:helix-turn-helix transcriptional regulator [Subtercola boreus]RFA16814.1 hypothetical protein B7R21_01500 [Subtercola boreus]